MTSYGVSPDDGGSLEALFEGSPDLDAHTSAAAETAFLLGLLALIAAPFSMMYAVSLGAGVLAFVCGVVGMATTSRPNVAGRALDPIGLACACTALLLVGLRYLGVDTAFGDGLLPTIGAWLNDLNAHLPEP